MIKASYYYTFKELSGDVPFKAYDMTQLLKDIFNEETLTGLYVPTDLVTNKTIYDELASAVLSRYRDHAVIKITKFCHNVPTQEEIDEAFKQWGYKFVAMLNDSHDYFMTLLLNYNNAKADLMADITATSANKVKYNDTPQNPNTLNVYEGDDYITNFTATEGETSSPLMSKIMRLKEIQDNYKNMMFEWVKVFERIFYQEEA